MTFCLSKGCHSTCKYLSVVNTLEMQHKLSLANVAIAQNSPTKSEERGEYSVLGSQTLATLYTSVLTTKIVQPHLKK